MKLSTTTKKLVLAGLVCAIPLGLLAHDKYEDKNEKHNNHKDSYKAIFFDDDRGEHYESKYQKELYEKKGVNYVFEGKLEKKPLNSLSGKWLISGKTITVDENTVIYQENKTFKVGDEIYIAAKRVGSDIMAIELEQD